jgi:TolB protein
VWHPNGGWICFTKTSGAGGEAQLWLVSATGDELRRLTDAGYNVGAEFSPDGSSVAYNRHSGIGFDVMRLDIETGKQTPIASFKAWEAGPQWSPDGSRISFLSNTDGNYEIYVSGSDGRNKVRITESAADESSPEWSPDGKSLYYTMREGQGDIFRLGLPDRLHPTKR